MKKKKAGRPKKINKMVTIAVDVTKDERMELDFFAKAINASRSSQARRAINELLLKFGRAREE